MLTFGCPAQVINRLRNEGLGGATSSPYKRSYDDVLTS